MNHDRKKLPVGSILATAALVWLAVACGSASPSTGPSPSATDPPSSGTPSPDGFVADVEAMLVARDTIHPNGWHGMARADWVAAADEATARAAARSPDAQLAELVRLAAMPTWAGRDGHSGIFPFARDSGTHIYPLRWWRFPEGLVITAARSPSDDLVGARVEAIGGRPIDEVLALVEPLTPRDNPTNLLAFSTLYLRTGELLAGLGVIDAVGPTPFTVVDRDGSRRDVVIEPVAVEARDEWDSAFPHRLPATDALWLRDQDSTFWWTFLEDSGTLFAQFNHVRGDAASSIAEFLERAREPDVERVVVDVRHNSGGDNTTLGPLEQALRDPAIDRPGRLFMITGRVTFSAAANFSADIEQTTSAVFVGEPTGGSPNLYGDTRPVRLTGSDQTLRMAARYWERSTPDDPRVAIDPDLPAELTADDYFAGRDPALDAILAAAPAGD